MTVKYFEGSEVVTRKFIVVGVESEREDQRPENHKNQGEETERYKIVSEKIEPWGIFRRDFDVFIITVRFEHQIEGKREYKTRREIEDLSDVIFEGRAMV